MKPKFEQLLDVIDYGMEFQRDNKDEEGMADYLTGVVETVGFITSCCIVQWFGHSGISTQDVVEALELDTLPDRKKIRRMLKRLLFVNSK
jgi:hypothetical protein